MVEIIHDAWTWMGGELLVYYINTAPEDWEFTPTLNQLDTPRLRAALTSINTLPRVPVTIGQEIPGTLIARTATDASLAVNRERQPAIDCKPAALPSRQRIRIIAEKIRSWN